MRAIGEPTGRHNMIDLGGFSLCCLSRCSRQPIDQDQARSALDGRMIPTVGQKKSVP
jgi:hypothetical protein